MQMKNHSDSPSSFNLFEDFNLEVSNFSLKNDIFKRNRNIERKQNFIECEGSLNKLLAKAYTFITI